MRILLAAVLASLLGCAPAPRNSDTTPVRAPAPATTAASTRLQTHTADSERQEFKPPPGYRVRIKEWDIVYCRKMSILGTRFPKEVCMTETQLKEHMTANEAMRRDKDQSSRICTSGCDTT